MSDMLAKHEKNCQWGCCPEFGRKTDKAVVRRNVRRKEKQVWKKDAHDPSKQ